MKKLLLVVLALASLTISSVASATVIDFSSVDAFSADGYKVARVGDVTFSQNVGSHPDGFYYMAENQWVHNWYGETGEYFVFDEAVHFTSLDIGFSCCTTPDTMTISLFDSGDNLLDSLTFDWANAWTTYTFDQANVSKVQLDFTGGSNAYSDGRLHAWYGMDNIVYSANVPESASLALMLFALAGLGFARRK